MAANQSRRPARLVSFAPSEAPKVSTMKERSAGKTVKPN
jgi:hypothetical protein